MPEAEIRVQAPVDKPFCDVGLAAGSQPSKLVRRVRPPHVAPWTLDYRTSMGESSHMETRDSSRDCTNLPVRRRGCRPMHGGPAFESLAGSVFHFGGVAERLKASVPKTGGRKSRRFESCPLRMESWLNGKSAGLENRFPVTPDRRVGTCTLRQEGCLNGQRNALLRRRPKGHAGSSPAPSAKSL